MVLWCNTGVYVCAGEHPAVYQNPDGSHAERLQAAQVGGAF